MKPSFKGCSARKDQATGFPSAHQRAICDALIICNQKIKIKNPTFFYF